jgi:two-component system, LytTR family, response regulator
MIRTVLVDDEIDSNEVLQTLLKAACPNVSIVGKADGVAKAIQIIQTTQPDLVFLDIEMTQGNAFDLLNQLQPIAFRVIFVTAFDNYALRAFKYSAVDYLLKPVDIDDLRKAVEKVTTQLQAINVKGQVQTIIENFGSIQLSQQKMALPTLTGLEFVTIRDIIRLEAKGNYTMVFLSDRRQIMVARNIKDYEGLLPELFFYRVHKSHIINLQKIQKYQKGRGGYIIMEDGSSIEVASRRREEFFQRLLK